MTLRGVYACWSSSGAPTATMSAPRMATAPGCEHAPRGVHGDHGAARDEQIHRLRRGSLGVQKRRHR